MINMEPPDKAPDAEDLASRVRSAMKSPELSREAKAQIAKMWGFARMLDAAVLLALEDEGL